MCHNIPALEQTDQQNLSSLVVEIFSYALQLTQGWGLDNYLWPCLFPLVVRVLLPLHPSQSKLIWFWISSSVQGQLLPAGVTPLIQLQFEWPQCLLVCFPPPPWGHCLVMSSIQGSNTLDVPQTPFSSIVCILGSSNWMIEQRGTCQTCSACITNDRTEYLKFSVNLRSWTTVPVEINLITHISICFIVIRGNNKIAVLSDDFNKGTCHPGKDSQEKWKCEENQKLD